ncbi:hypothetical protein [Acidocella sp.]|uniref:hypothetical protein n=1 Tax=Acidocella sp. TaxID=50710 RepID=UPI002611E1FA|nr:hypothetical protein [Acidocella sp.]
MADEDEIREYASPACFAHEIVGPYMGFIGQEEPATAPNNLLEPSALVPKRTLREVRQIGNIATRGSSTVMEPLPE